MAAMVEVSHVVGSVIFDLSANILRDFGRIYILFELECQLKVRNRYNSKKVNYSEGSLSATTNCLFILEKVYPFKVNFIFILY